MTTDLSQLHYVTVQADLPDMHIYYLLIISYTQCVPPNVHLIFFNTRSKISRFEFIFGTQNPGEISEGDLYLSTTSEKCYHCTSGNADLMHLIEVALLLSKK